MVPEPPAPSPSVLTTADDVRAALLELSDESKAAQVARYLRAVPGGYGEGDRFHGVPVPCTRAVARRAVLDDGELERLVASPWHEERMAALCVAVAQAKRISRLLGSRRAQQDPDSPAIEEALARREELGQRYLGWVGQDLVNNWDLVDTSAEHLVGAWLLVPLVGDQKLPSRIGDLITSSSVWERRVAVMSTFATTRAGTDWPAYAVARQLLNDPHDLIHKAVGWMLREAGKRVDEGSLVAFLDRYAARMPRTMLRYAIERLSPEVRAHYRSLRA
ncbi:DNA alkylation repair protein [Actinomyces viscosus]|uniref:DNA alkylation repair enzyme n=2 Tax=Actinomyces viscosus TaxID=1656 RepID=A0A3S4WIS6_ACTVI|nr:DNA alkylation repair protein [Actinomyces viscosus]TFH53997.1 DNA alkylation repair protein [Actinomyces viscosus]VEI14956.1 DNA alkylation repair enzyme [Actinomyces viscosus]